MTTSLIADPRFVVIIVASFVCTASVGQHPHTGQARHILTGHTNWVMAIAVAPDGTWLATASRDNTVRIWGPHTGQARHTLTGHTGLVAVPEAMAVAPDGTWLATVGSDATVRIWTRTRNRNSRRVSHRRFARTVSLLCTANSIIAAGQHAPYIIEMRRPDGRQPQDRQLVTP